MHFPLYPITRRSPFGTFRHFIPRAYSGQALALMVKHGASGDSYISGRMFHVEHSHIYLPSLALHLGHGANRACHVERTGVPDKPGFGLAACEPKHPYSRVAFCREWGFRFPL